MIENVETNDSGDVKASESDVNQSDKSENAEEKLENDGSSSHEEDSEDEDFIFASHDYCIGSDHEVYICINDTAVRRFEADYPYCKCFFVIFRL